MGQEGWIYPKRLMLFQEKKVNNKEKMCWKDLRKEAFGF